MIDFKRSEFLHLKSVKYNNEAANLLIDGENVIGSYKTIRDSIVFTDKRIITINVQGISGKKKDYTSLPYSKIQAFSVETAGTFDLDSELILWFSGLGKVKFNFTGQSDIVTIGKEISKFALK